MSLRAVSILLVYLSLPSSKDCQQEAIVKGSPTKGRSFVIWRACLPESGFEGLFLISCEHIYRVGGLVRG